MQTTLSVSLEKSLGLISEKFTYLPQMSKAVLRLLPVPSWHAHKLHCSSGLAPEVGSASARACCGLCCP